MKDMDEPLQHKSLVERIAEELEAKIITGSIRPGQRVIEGDLCRTYGVSRSPVREAFQILQSRGFVVHEPRKGISVTRINRREAEDINLIRASLEELAMSLAVRNRTPELLKKLHKLHKQMIRTAQKGTETAYDQLNQRFHELINEACGNKRLTQLIHNFCKQTMRYRMAVIAGRGWMEKSQESHKAIIESFEIGDAEAAGRIRKSVLLSQIERLAEIFKNEEQESNLIRRNA
jgi:DNA-binding GntR family transcriptional regulator